MNDTTQLARGMVTIEEWLENLSDEDRQKMIEHLIKTDPTSEFWNRLQVVPTWKGPKDDGAHN
jgi:hypothetical protein